MLFITCLSSRTSLQSVLFFSSSSVFFFSHSGHFLSVGLPKACIKLIGNTSEMQGGCEITQSKCFSTRTTAHTHTHTDTPRHTSPTHTPTKTHMHTAIHKNVFQWPNLDVNVFLWTVFQSLLWTPMRFEIRYIRYIHENLCLVLSQNAAVQGPDSLLNWTVFDSQNPQTPHIKKT